MSYRFRVDHWDSPADGVVRRWGVATRLKGKGGDEVPFYVTVSPVSVHLSTEDSAKGRKLIAYFTRLIGFGPTLKYRDVRGDYRDLTAEWMPEADSEDIIKRLMLHLKLGFESEEVR